VKHSGFAFVLVVVVTGLAQAQTAPPPRDPLLAESPRSSNLPVEPLLDATPVLVWQRRVTRRVATDLGIRLGATALHERGDSHWVGIPVATVVFAIQF